MYCTQKCKIIKTPTNKDRWDLITTTPGNYNVIHENDPVLKISDSDVGTLQNYQQLHRLYLFVVPSMATFVWKPFLGFLIYLSALLCLLPALFRLSALLCLLLGLFRPLFWLIFHFCYVLHKRVMSCPCLCFVMHFAGFDSPFVLPYFPLLVCLARTCYVLPLSLLCYAFFQL